MSKEYKIIKITKGKEYQAKLDKVYQQEVFFSDSYRKARNSLKEIIAINKAELTQRKKEYDEEEISSARGFLKLNNVIAFCADRGQGKSSALRSFAKELEEVSRDDRFSISRSGEQLSLKDREDRNAFWKDITDMPLLEYLNEPIDPESMREGDSILRIILSRMYKRFLQRVENNQYSSPARSKMTELAKSFMRCFEYVDIIEKGQNDKWRNKQDTLDQMEEIGNSGNLRNQLVLLVTDYLKFMHRTARDNAYLVLAIDDADVNIRLGYYILEDIRNYLMIPNVIILLACNMNQMESVVEQHFIQEYQASIQNHGMVDVERAHRIGELYLEKVIPSTRRIFLPDMSEFWKICSVRYKSNDTKYINPANEKSASKAWDDRELTNLLDNALDYTYQQQLLQLLHRKTGLIFMEPGNFLHNILPRNLRELTHFLVYFTDLDDIFTSENGYTFVCQCLSGNITDSAQEILKKWKYNLEQLELYLTELWSASQLRNKSRDLLKELMEEPLGRKNEFILNALSEYYTNERIAYVAVHGSADDRELVRDYEAEFLNECERRGVTIPINTKILDNAGEAYSCNYSDVMTALSVLTDLPGANRQYAFVYGVRLYYSVLLHKLLIERLQDKSSAMESITYFIGDGLVCRDNDYEPMNKTAQLAFDRSCFKEEVLFEGMEDSLRKMKEPNFKGDGFSIYFPSFFRRQLTVGNSKILRPLAWNVAWRKISSREQKGLESNILIFNPFYPMLHYLDQIFLKDYSKTEKENTLDITAMIFSLQIMLNWDVQYEILHALRKMNVASTENEGLFKMISDLYTDSNIREVFRELHKINRDYPEIELTSIANQFVPAENKEFKRFINENKSLLEKYGLSRRKVSLKIPLNMLNKTEETIEKGFDWGEAEGRLLTTAIKENTVILGGLEQYAEKASEICGLLGYLPSKEDAKDKKLAGILEKQWEGIKFSEFKNAHDRINQLVRDSSVNEEVPIDRTGEKKIPTTELGKNTAETFTPEEMKRFMESLTAFMTAAAEWMKSGVADSSAQGNSGDDQ